MLNAVTIIGRAIWRIIGGGILRYGMGLIIWTIVAVALTLKDIFSHSRDEKDKTLFYILIFLFIIRGLVQFSLNFMTKIIMK